MDDAGIYVVKAINIEGEAKCEGSLNILPSLTNIPPQTANIPMNIQPQPMNIPMNIQPLTTNIATIVQPNGFPPEFLQLFTDQQTFINSAIKFEARLIGTPPLNVKI